MEVREAMAGVDIAAPPQRVWDVVTDITVLPRFSSELLEVQWDDGVGGRLGARFHGRNRHPAIGEWTTRSEVIGFDPPRLFAWAVGDPGNPSATWTFTLSPIESGTRLDYTAQIGPGPSGVTMMIERDPESAAEIVERRLRQLRAAMEATLSGIRDLAESG